MQLEAIVLGDDPASWEALGFRVEPGGHGGGIVTLANTSVELTGEGGGFLGWRIEGVGHDLDGIPTAGRVRAGPGAPVRHPNGISSIDHVVVRTGDVDRTVATMQSAGLRSRGGRTTTSYGAPMRQVFLWAGDVILEVVGPDTGDRGEDEAAAVEAATVFGLALVADDLDDTGERLGDLMGTPKDAVQAGRRIAGLRGGEVGVSMPLAVMSPHGPTGA
jgi:hypothetical protein